MTQGLHPLAANMINQLNRVDVISNNLANANTVGFKEDHLIEGSFNEYMDRVKAENIEPMKQSEIMNTIPKIDGQFFNEEKGATLKTGNAFDFAIDKPGLYFKVLNTDTNTIEYTRDGTFKEQNGELVTQNGYKVLNGNNQAIAVNINNLLTNEIALVSIESRYLDKVGNNNYKVVGEGNVKDFANDGLTLLQGAVEFSNVNTITTMVDLIEAQRRFEQSQKAIRSIDEVNAKVIESVGNNK